MAGVYARGEYAPAAGPRRGRGWSATPAGWADFVQRNAELAARQAHWARLP